MKPQVLVLIFCFSFCLMKFISCRISIFTDGDSLYQYPGQLNWCGSRAISGQWTPLIQADPAISIKSGMEDTFSVNDVKDNFTDHTLTCKVGEYTRNITFIVVNFGDIRMKGRHCVSSTLAKARKEISLTNPKLTREVKELVLSFEIICRASFQESELSNERGYFNIHGNLRPFYKSNNKCMDSPLADVKLNQYRIVSRIVKCYSSQCDYVNFHVELLDIDTGYPLLLSRKTESFLRIPYSMPPGDYFIVCVPKGIARKHRRQVAILKKPGIPNVVKINRNQYKCEIPSGHPIPKLSWEPASSNEDGRFASDLDEYNDNHLFLPKSLTRSYYYKCVARNEAGETAKKISVGEEYKEDIKSRGIWNHLTIPKFRLVVNGLILGAFPLMAILVAYRKKILQRFRRSDSYSTSIDSHED